MSGMGEHSLILAWGIDICAGLLLSAILIAFVRMVKGPTLVDRVVSVDLITVLAVAVAGLVGIASRHAAILDVAVATALVAFLATVAFAWFANRRADQFESDTTPSGNKEGK
ncbi:MAG: monovalent cation/H+ antiporter complex subunit F [Bryobacterales bacterium]|nr:monovalent cation/H+ antiporter complex subunit F [Bryobacterales bacterium]